MTFQPVDWAGEFFSPLYLTLYRDHLLGDEATAAEAAFAMETLGLDTDSRVLDLACGFGRHLRWWRREGLRHVVGLDINAGFLKAAREGALADDEGLTSPSPPLLVQGMAEQLPFAGQAFDAVACLFNSLGYQDLAAVGIETVPGESCDIAAIPLAERAARGPGGTAAPNLARDQAIVSEAARVLRRYGALLIDVPARHGMTATIEDHPITHIITAGGYELTELWSVDRARRLLFCEGRVTRRDKSWHYRYCVYLYDEASLRALLEPAGFELSVCCDDFDGNEYDDAESDRLIALARRL